MESNLGALGQGLNLMLVDFEFGRLLVKRSGPSLSDWAVHRQTEFNRKILEIFRSDSLG